MIVIPVVRVGNSRGIRFPKKILEAIGAPTEVRLDLQDGVLVIHPVIAPRQGWADAARWHNTTLEREDLEWLDAPLMDHAGHE
jgi:antitoxin component of MazEF toxin-antitoxin module